VKPHAVARAIAELTLTRKAADVLLMDLRGLTSMADYFVVCSADSDIQVRAISEAVEEGMEGKGIRPWHIESGSANWILLDFVDVVLHVFHKNTRPFYNLEKLWGDAVIERVSEEPPPPAPKKAPSRKAPAAKKKAATTKRPSQARAKKPAKKKAAPAKRVRKKS
jgi:ribosome-associated protein